MPCASCVRVNDRKLCSSAPHIPPSRREMRLLARTSAPQFASLLFLLFCLAGKHFNCQIVLVYCCNSFVDGQVCLSETPPQSVAALSTLFGLRSCVLGPRLLSLVFKVIFADVVAFYSVCRRRPGRRRRRR